MSEIDKLIEKYSPGGAVKITLSGTDIEVVERDGVKKDLEQLKSSLPEPVEVPQFVAEWIKGNDLSIRSIFWQLENCNIVNLDVAEWIDKNESLFVNAVINGYTVLKEPLYRVLLTDLDSGYDFTYLTKTGALDVENVLDEVDLLTEKQIKAIDKRYWAFAVPMEEEG